MRVLFTKSSINNESISQHFNDNIVCDYIDVIKIESCSVEPFDLQTNSIIFTSVNAVDSFFKNGFTPQEDFTQTKFNKIYCVGSKTKKRLRENGFGTFKLAKNAKELSDFIVGNSNKENFLHFCGNIALDVLDRDLPLQNISYKKIVVYNTELLFPKVEQYFDAIVFFSPSGVRSFLYHNSIDGKKIFSIGSTTTEEIKKHTDTAIITSEEISLKDILRLISMNTEQL